MSALSSRKTYVALAAFQAGDAVACAIPVPYITKALDNLGVPPGIRWIFPVVKVAAALGLLSVLRYPALARLTTAMLTLYFVLAVGAHIRARDRLVNAVPAASFLATFAAMTLKGPDRRQERLVAGVAAALSWGSALPVPQRADDRFAAPLMR